MNILILEDNGNELKILYNILRKQWTEFHYTCCQSYEHAEQAVLSTQYDIFILDIQLSSSPESFSGVTFARYIRSIPDYQNTPILFITGTSEHILKCINEIHCYNYLEKPYNKSTLIHAIENLIVTLSNPIYKNHLTIKLLNDVTTHICFSNILLIKANGHCLTFLCSNDSCTSSTYSLSSITPLLPSYFTRCHRKYIINTNFITFYDKTNLYVRILNHTIPVGRTFKKELENHLLY